MRQFIALAFVIAALGYPGAIAQEPMILSAATGPILHEKLKPICSCESTGYKDREPQHYDANGDVLRGKVNSDDIGMCQINLRWHGQEAKEMGIDLFSEEGNITFANWLFENEGTKPWNWSKPCWD